MDQKNSRTDAPKSRLISDINTIRTVECKVNASDRHFTIYFLTSL